MQKLISLLLLIIVALLTWQLYLTRQGLSQSQQQVAALTSNLETTQSEVEALKLHLQELEKQSIKGVVNETNEAILDGWEALVDTFEEQVERARKSLDDAINEGKTDHQTPNSTPKTPRLESDDGTERT